MRETVDPQTTEQLELISRKFQEAINNNDAAAVAELFAEDGVFVTDAGPLCGREAIENFFADLFKEWRLSIFAAAASRRLSAEAQVPVHAEFLFRFRSCLW